MWFFVKSRERELKRTKKERPFLGFGGAPLFIPQFLPLKVRSRFRSMSKELHDLFVGIAEVEVGELMKRNRASAPITQYSPHHPHIPSMSSPHAARRSYGMSPREVRGAAKVPDSVASQLAVQFVNQDTGQTTEYRVDDIDLVRKSGNYYVDVTATVFMPAILDANVVYSIGTRVGNTDFHYTGG